MEYEVIFKKLAKHKPVEELRFSRKELKIIKEKEPEDAEKRARRILKKIEPELKKEFRVSREQAVALIMESAFQQLLKK